ncbi:MAG: DUF192 domain-containing protein [Betaproteobacteria bacterium]|nr:DUF192 domain-containing protein [Betaproteobacteria bacterium]
MMAFTVAAALGAPAAMAQMSQIRLAAGMHLVQAEVASTNETRTQGLMYRTSMGPNQGMLFVFPHDEAHCMWMKNTLIPLVVAFIDAKGQIVSIHEMKPKTETPQCATAPARYALEMNAGWFRTKGILAGTRITGLEKAPAPR